MKIEATRKHWNGDIYDREETGTEDIACFLALLGNRPQKVLEVSCGTGRILIPLAKAGHEANGFDIDEGMLARIPAKAQGIENLHYWQADALGANWGGKYDAIIMGGNLLINIITPGDYTAAQRKLIANAAECLEAHGRLLLEFDLHKNPAAVFNYKDERTIFEGTDDEGVYGRYSISDGRYDPATQVCRYKMHTTLRLPGGETHEIAKSGMKHIPTLEDVKGWLKDASCKVTEEYGDFHLNPIGKGTHKAILVAEMQ